MFQSRLLPTLFWFLCGNRARVVAYYNVITNLLFGLLRDQMCLSNAW